MGHEAGESPERPVDEAVLARRRAAFLRACRLDVEVDKPGNVSVRQPGHRMVAQQFLDSAEAAAPALFAPGMPVGRRILDAVARTRDAAGCNTNLGIILLTAPLAAALDALPGPVGTGEWRLALETVLARLDLDDARDAYLAIALAQPAGLGDTDQQSVHDVPTVGLREAMALAAARDSVARQYAVGYEDLFETGLAAWRAYDGRREPHLATLGVFMTFLGRWPDSHIVRKLGMALGQSVTADARRLWRDAAPRHADNADGEPGPAPREALAAWDTSLKARGINPGTSADLTVATVFIASCLD